jgi:trimethylamine--corrinoid protein Co-methyltransferase
MQSEYLYPEVGDRRSAGEWEEAGSPTVYALAHEKVKEILSSHYPQYIDPKADAAIRAAFPIRLAAEEMSPGNGRWDS